MPFNKEVYDQWAAKGFCFGMHVGGGEAPEQVCVEAAICMALGEPLNDTPSCVDDSLRRLTIGLNDMQWTSTIERSAGLYRLGLLGIGTQGKLIGSEFLEQIIKDFFWTIWQPAMLHEFSAYPKVIDRFKAIPEDRSLVSLANYIQEMDSVIRLYAKSAFYNAYCTASEFSGAIRQMADSLHYYTNRIKHIEANLAFRKNVQAQTEGKVVWPDLYSVIAVDVFGLDCEPTKAKLAELNKLHLRTLVKIVLFRTVYVDTVDNMLADAKRAKLNVSSEDIFKIIEHLREHYLKFLACSVNNYRPTIVCNLLECIRVTQQLLLRSCRHMLFIKKVIKMIEEAVEATGHTNEFVNLPMPDFRKELAGE